MTAFTTGSVDRQANIQVVNDSQGLIGLEDGTSGDQIRLNESGALLIDMSTDEGAAGLNAEAKFEFGNPDNPTNQTAFTITNNDAETHDVSLGYATDSDDGNSADNIQFRIYDSAGLVGTVSEETGEVTAAGTGPGETLYVVMVVDTRGVDGGTSYNGTVTVTVDN